MMFQANLFKSSLTDASFLCTAHSITLLKISTLPNLIHIFCIFHFLKIATGKMDIVVHLTIMLHTYKKKSSDLIFLLN